MNTNQRNSEIRRLREIIAHAHQLLAELEAMAPRQRRVTGKRALTLVSRRRIQRTVRSGATRLAGSA